MKNSGIRPNEQRLIDARKVELTLATMKHLDSKQGEIASEIAFGYKMCLRDLGIIEHPNKKVSPAIEKMKKIHQEIQQLANNTKTEHRQDMHDMLDLILDIQELRAELNDYGIYSEYPRAGMTIEKNTDAIFVWAEMEEFEPANLMFGTKKYPQEKAARTMQMLSDIKEKLERYRTRNNLYSEVEECQEE